MDQSEAERTSEKHKEGPDDSQNGFIIDYSRFFTQLAKNRQPDPLGVILDRYNPCPKDLVSLAGGLPNPELAPFGAAHLQVKNGTSITLDEQDMGECMQYGKTQGYDPLLEHLRAMTQDYHHPPHWHQRDIMVTLGCQDAIAKVVEAMVDIGDYIIVPEPCYSGVLALLAPYTPKYLRIMCDEEGIRTDSLQQELSRWSPEEVRHVCHGIPKVLYVNPCCANPIGGSLSLKRRQDIYAIAHEYNLVILEDDPYYFLQFDGTLLPSFLSLDVDGRVIRFDSFSKVISAGLRIGHVTAPRDVIERLVFHVMSAMQHVPVITQMMVSRLMEAWGRQGFERQVEKVRSFYQHRRDVMVQAANKYLHGLCTWHVPIGGMFVWFKVLGVADTKVMLERGALKHKVLLLPGAALLCPKDDASAPNSISSFLRASFSLATSEDIEQGIERLAALIREELELTQATTEAPQAAQKEGL